MDPARHTPHLMDADSGNPFLKSLAGHASVLSGTGRSTTGAPEPEPRRFPETDLRDINLSFSGRASGENGCRRPSGAATRDLSPSTRPQPGPSGHLGGAWGQVSRRASRQ